MLAYRILEIVFPIFAIVAVGILYGRRFKPDLSTANHINMDIFVPALMFSVLVGQNVSLGNFSTLIISATVVVLGAGLLGWLIARLCNVQPLTLVPPLMFCNSGNMGLPLLVLAFGEEALGAAVIVFLVENVLHFSLGTYLLNHRSNPLTIFSSPVVVAAILGLGVNFLAIELPETILTPIDMLGQVCIPLMLFSLGVRLSDANFNEWKIGMLGTLSSFITGVAIAWGTLQFVDLPPLQQGVLFMFGALPPAVLNFIFAERYQQEPSKVAAIILFSHAGALLTIPLALSYALPKFT